MVRRTSTLLNEVSDSFSLLDGHLEDIVEAVENDLDDLGVLHYQQVAEWRNHLLLNQVRHLQAHGRCGISAQLPVFWPKSITQSKIVLDIEGNIGLKSTTH